MSLTSHLKDANSPIGQFISQRFPQTSSITKVTNKTLGDVSTINPGFPSWVYSHLGMAIDYTYPLQLPHFQITGSCCMERYMETGTEAS